MRPAAIVLTGLLVVVILALFVRMRTQDRTVRTETSKDVYLGLRNQALQSSRIELELTPTQTPTTPWGVVMDWGVAEGTATVVAFSDGHASIYLSTGGGFLGGAESHEAIRTAAKQMVTIAAGYQSRTHLAESYPLPEPGSVNFYLLTDSGIFTATASQEDLSQHRHPMSGLGDAVQEVISWYQRIQ